MQIILSWFSLKSKLVNFPVPGSPAPCTRNGDTCFNVILTVNMVLSHHHLRTAWSFLPALYYLSLPISQRRFFREKNAVSSVLPSVRIHCLFWLLLLANWGGSERDRSFIALNFSQVGNIETCCRIQGEGEGVLGSRCLRGISGLVTEREPDASEEKNFKTNYSHICRAR